MNSLPDGSAIAVMLNDYAYCGSRLGHARPSQMEANMSDPGRCCGGIYVYSIDEISEAPVG